MIVLAVTLSLTECLIIIAIGAFFYLGPWATSRSARKRIAEKNCFTHASNDSRKEMEEVCKLVEELDTFQFVSSSDNEWLYKVTYKQTLKGKLPELAALFRAAHIAGVNLSVRLRKDREAEEEANGGKCISSFVTCISRTSVQQEREKKEDDEKREKIQSHGYYK